MDQVVDERVAPRGPHDVFARLDPRGPLGLRVACPERGQQRIGGALQIAVLAGERQRQHVGADAELASERRGGGQPLEREHRLARR